MENIIAGKLRKNHRIMGQIYYVFLLFISHFKLASAYVQDSELIPYSTGSQRFHFDDDDFTAVTFPGSGFSFLGGSYSQVYINENGLISFEQGAGATSYYCNVTYPVYPAISVYMADAYNHKNDPPAPMLLYKSDSTSASLAKVSEDVFTAFPDLKDQLSLSTMLVITWVNIPPIAGNFKHQRNTYQAVLATSYGSISFVLLYYNSINWYEKTSGRYPAQVGIYGGRANFRNSYLVPGSCNYSIVNIAGMSNINKPGKFVFRVDQGLVTPKMPSCLQMEKSQSQPNFTVRVTFTPYIVQTLGTVPLLVKGLQSLCMDYPATNVTCTFKSSNGTTLVQVDGGLIPGQVAVFCQKPEFSYLGRVRVDVRIRFKNGGHINVNGFIYVVREMAENVNLFVGESEERKNFHLLATWSIPFTKMLEIALFYKRNMNREFSGPVTFVNVTLLELSGYRWKELYNYKNVSNSGTLPSNSPPEFVRSTLLSERLESPPRALVVSNGVEMQDKNVLRADYVSNILEVTVPLLELKISSRDKDNLYDKRCKQWHVHEPSPPQDTLACPLHLTQAQLDWRFYQNTLSTAKGIMNPLNYTIFMQSTPSPSGAGMQCAYTGNGDLVIGYPYGSRLHRHSPNNQNDYWNHYWDDIIPYLQCCVLSYHKEKNCKEYFFAKRPSYDGSAYQPPTPFRATGATHVTTFDGSVYLLNNVGIFWLVKYASQFQMQVLLEKYDGGPASKNATTVITSAVMAALSDDNVTLSKFQVSANSSLGMLIWLDEEPLNFYYNEVSNETEFLTENFTLQHDHVTVLVNGTSEATFSFATGVSLKFTLSAGNMSLNIIGSASHTWMRKTSGLLGDFDGNGANDLTFGNGTMLSTNATIDTISKEFTEKWRVYLPESLFTYPPGKNFADYDNRANFQPYHFSRADILKVASTNSICNGSEDCLIDNELTGNQPFAQTSADSYILFEKLGQVFNATEFAPRRCQDPKEISNGGYVGRKYIVGSSILYNCESGYHFSNKNMSTSLSTEIELKCEANELLPNDDIIDNVYKATWVSKELNRSMASLNIECLPDEEEKQQASHKAIDTKISISPKVISHNGITTAPIFISVNHKLTENGDNFLGTKCKFTGAGSAETYEAQGIVLNDMNNNSTSTVICMLPFLHYFGEIDVKLVAEYLGKPPIYFYGQFWITRAYNSKLVPNHLDISFESENNSFTLKWNQSYFETLPLPGFPTVFNGDSESCDMTLALMQFNGKVWGEQEKILSTICNKGEFTANGLSLFQRFKNVSILDLFSTPTIFILRNVQSSTRIEMVATSELLTSLSAFHDIMKAVKDNNLQDADRDFDKLCEQWHDHESQDITKIYVLPCPPTLLQASVDWRFNENNLEYNQFLNPGADHVFVQSTPSTSSKAGSQCPYNGNGYLILGSPAGSRIHRYNINTRDSYLNHFTHDVLPYMYCCRWSTEKENNCQNHFYGKRGVSLKERYEPSTFAQGYGVSHFHTFDDLRYRLKSTGQFWMIKHQRRSWNAVHTFKCQVRLKPFDGKDSRDLSVISVVAMEQTVNGHKTKMEVSRNASGGGLKLLVDGVSADNNELTSLYYEGLTVFSDRKSFEATVVFQYGYAFKFSISCTGLPGINVIVTADPTLVNQTVGLIGNEVLSRNDAVLVKNDTMEGVTTYQVGRNLQVSENDSIFSHSPSDLSYAQQAYIETEPELHIDKEQDIELKLISLCTHSVDCILDNGTTGHEFAMSVIAAVEEFQEIMKISGTAHKGCIPPVVEESNKFIVNGLAVGSVLQVQCSANGLDSIAKLICSETGNSSFEWVSPNGDVVLNQHSSLCSGKPSNSERLSTTESSNGSMVIVTLLVIITIMVVVGVAIPVVFALKRKRETRQSDSSTEIDLLQFDDFGK